MKNRIVKLVCPQKSSMVKMSISHIPVTGTMGSIYNTVDFFRDEIFSKSKIETFNKKITKRVPLRDIVNLHNDTGIRDISQTESMVQKIKSGKDILSPDGLPNIKLIRTRSNEWVLFDGHHSMLAYMLAGRRYLDEVPHLIVEDGERVYVSDDEIGVFFGKHSVGLKDKDWRKYVIDWQAREENQLQRRIQNDMGELLDALSQNECRVY